MLALLCCSWLLVQTPDHPRPDCARAAWRPLREVWQETASRPAHELRCVVPVPAEWAGKRVFLCGSGVATAAEVVLADRVLLRHAGITGSFSAELGELAGTDLGLALRLSAPERAVHRELWLEARGRAWVAALQVTVLSLAPGRVRVAATLGGDPRAVGRVELHCASAASRDTALVDGSAVLELPLARPWSVDDPALVPFQVTVHDPDGALLDQVESRLGLAAWTPPDQGAGLRLGGQPFGVRGGQLERASSDPPEVQLRALRALGLNAVLLAADQLAPRLGALADQLGLAILCDLRGCPEAAASGLRADHQGHPAVAAWLTSDAAPALVIGTSAAQIAALARSMAPGTLVALPCRAGDVSWQLQELVGAVRAQPALGGFVCQGLPRFSTADAGFLDLAPRMVLADLLGPVHLGSGLPLVTRARPGQEFAVPLVLAVASEGDAHRFRTGRMHGSVSGFDDRGLEVSQAARRGGAVEAVVGGVASPPPLRLRLPEREGLYFLAVWATVPSDQPADVRFGGRVLARNVCCVDTRQDHPPAARVDGRELVLPFAPARVWQLDAEGARVHPTQVSWPHGGSVSYRLALPPQDGIQGITLRFEASACADPRTGARPIGRVVVNLQGQDMEPIDLPAETADARGVLSHAARWQAGTWGRLCRIDVEGSEAEALLERARETGFLSVTLRSEALGGAAPAGLRLFGARGGRYPFDPELSLRFAAAPAPFVRDPVIESANRMLVRPGEPWRVATQDPGPGSGAVGFDDRTWSETRDFQGSGWVRRAFVLAAPDAARRLWLRVAPEGADEVWLDGTSVLQLDNPSSDPVEALVPGALVLAAGAHVLAVRGRPVGLFVRND